jgi:hypothetical protein
VQVQVPDVAPEERPNVDFSSAVAERSARIADRGAVSSTPIETFLAEPPVFEPSEPSIEQHPVLDPITDDELVGPTPEQAVSASGEIHLDEMFGPEAPWERSGQTGELESWADDFRDDDIAEGTSAALVRRGGGVGVGTRMLDGTHAAVERVLGSDKADATVDWLRNTGDRVSDFTRDARERLRRSEHATLIVAIGGGAVLIAVLVALGGALGGGDEKAAPSDTTATKVLTTDSTAPATGATTTKAAPKTEVGPMIPPSRLTLDIFNAGSKKGYAKEVAAKLKASGYKIGETANAKGDYSSATIIHPKDMSREAKVLARKTGISTLQVAPGSTRKITIVVT